MEEFQPSWWLIVTYLLLMFGIGIWAARTRVGRMEDMAVAGRSSGPWLIAFSVAATWINGTTLIGISGVAKDFGLSAYWTGGSFVLATIWMSYYVVPRLRATRIITVPQLFERFYGPRHRLVSLSLIILRDLGATAGVMGSLAVVTSSILQISLLQSLALVGALTLVYVFLGGMWAILVTDAIQFFIVSIGSVVLVVFGFLGSGGFSVLRSIEDPDFLGSFGTGGPSQVIAWVVIGISITFGYQSVIQRGLAASSTAAAHKGFLYGGIISTIWYMVPPLIGVLGRALYGADISGDDVFLRMTFGVAGGQLGSIIIVGILAASMSTLDSTINTIASNFTIDIYNRFLNPERQSQGSALALPPERHSGRSAGRRHLLRLSLDDRTVLAGRTDHGSVGGARGGGDGPVSQSPAGPQNRTHLHADRSQRDHPLPDPGKRPGSGDHRGRLDRRSHSDRSSHHRLAAGARHLVGDADS